MLMQSLLIQQRETLSLWGSMTVWDQDTSSQNVSESRMLARAEPILKEQTELLLLGNARGHNQVVIRNKEQAMPTSCFTDKRAKSKMTFF